MILIRSYDRLLYRFVIYFCPDRIEKKKYGCYDKRLDTKKNKRFFTQQLDK